MISNKFDKLASFSANRFWKKAASHDAEPAPRRGGSWTQTPFATLPHQYIATKNGRVLTVRRFWRDDAPDLVYLVEMMSDHSRYRRYHRPVSQEPPSWIWDEARELAQSDRCQKGGLIVLADLPEEGETAVGVAYFVRAGAGKAELAIALRDEFQGQGVGFQLLQFLAQEAWAAGHHTLIAFTQAENVAMNTLLSRLPYAQTRQRVGADIDVEIYLDQPVE